MPTQQVESRSSGLDDAAAETGEGAKFHSYAANWLPEHPARLAAGLRWRGC